MKLRVRPGEIPTRRRAWLWSFAHGLAWGLGFPWFALIGLAVLLPKPENPNNFAVTVLHTRGRDAPYESYRLDDRLVSPDWHAALDDGTSASATLRRFLAKPESSFAIVRSAAGRRESVEDGLPLRGFGRECHLILHRHPDRTEMRTCLAPVARSP